MKCSATTANIAFIISLIVVFYKASCCELSWNRYADHCYRIYTNTVTNYRARFMCQAEGSALVSITDVSTLNFLSEHIAQYPQSKFWVGLKSVMEGPHLPYRMKRDLSWNLESIEDTYEDSHSEIDGSEKGEFVWFDGTNANQSWIKMPETNVTSILEHIYGLICFAYDGQFVASELCYKSYGFICGHHISSNRNGTDCLDYEDPLKPEHSFVGEVTGNCLFRARNIGTKSMVQDECNRHRGHFVDFDEMMKDGLSAFYDHKVLSNDESRYWTNFEWNGTNLIRSNGEIVPDQYPISVVKGSGSCVTVQFNFTDILSTKFYQTECNKVAFIVCSLGMINQDPPSSTTRRSSENFLLNDGDNCPEGYNWKTDRNKNFCYWETSFETDQLSWDDAEKYCKSYGGHLGSFHSVEEERISLSFQYGSLAHDYWIGLTFDADNETYRWTDGSPLDYANWARGHPDHKDKRLRCVSMNAQDKHWTSSLCGILSWFICKVPKKNYHQMPSLPTPTPLEPCEKSSYVQKSSWYFEGACYFPVVESLSWHRAKQFCEDQGSSLVSIHSTDEIGFLLRLLHDASMETNRAWIGLNSFGSDGNFLWTDWTAVDFTYFASDEPNNFQNQEKCCNMNTRDGQWNDENCNAALSFVCKRINDTSISTIIPTTHDPRIGNCKKGWIAHLDRCYYIGGIKEKDRVNWTDAMDICQKNGGYLTSIRNSNEQNFLAYLLQMVGEDAWIGLHDTIQSGRYYWLDNSDLQYTNWAPGEPSFFGITEDCVKMVYNHLDSGVWKDDECQRKLGFICQSSKNPDLPAPPSDRGLNCVHPEGWLKLDGMCFKMFEGSPLTWIEALHACRNEDAELVSVSDQKVKAVVHYLATEINQPFFIGLRYDKDSRSVRWLNNFPVRLSNWEKNEPSFLGENTCFASTSEGYWKKSPCDEKMPYLCQVTTGKAKKLNQFVGECPSTSKLWFSGSYSYCYILDQELRVDWYTANLMCFRYGTHLASLHSMEEIEDIKKLIEPGVRSIYIGLMRNKKGGFTWTDDTPVNFENWDEEQPSNSDDQCVEIMTHNMKWRVASCLSKKHFICMDTKGTLITDDPEKAEYAAEYPGLSTTAVCAIFFSILIIVVLFVAAVLYRKKTYRMPQFRRQERNSSISFENALYEVSSSSMVFKEENKS